MLKHLHIQNYALISHLDIDFDAGFSVLTGETGAGSNISISSETYNLADFSGEVLDEIDDIMTPENIVKKMVDMIKGAGKQAD